MHFVGGPSLIRRLKGGTSATKIRIVAAQRQVAAGATTGSCSTIATSTAACPPGSSAATCRDEYNLVPATVKNATEKHVRLNPLGKATSNNLLSSRQNATGIEVHHCELVNGHDICLFGPGLRFHHNWVNNLNDDALFLGSEDSDTDDAWIAQGNTATTRYVRASSTRATGSKGRSTCGTTPAWC